MQTPWNKLCRLIKVNVYNEIKEDFKQRFDSPLVMDSMLWFGDCMENIEEDERNEYFKDINPEDEIKEEEDPIDAEGNVTED